MRARILSVMIGALPLALAAPGQPVTAQTREDAQPQPQPQPQPPPQPPATPGAENPSQSPTPSPPFTVLGKEEVQSILGQEVRSTADENMGRIVDVVVDGEGRARAAIVDFGGFFGVGSRKIAVDWKALRFVPTASKRYRIVLELSRDQVKAAPEYKEGRPIIVLGASGSLEPLP